jgi:hypothetical protein
MAEITYEQAMQGLKAASDAGDDTAAAQFAQIADSFRQQQVESQLPADAPATATDILTAKKGMWETLTSPTAPEEMSGQDILVSGALGAGIGAGTSSLTGIGVVPGAITGGITGITSGIAGEASRAAGNAPITNFLAEMVGGGGPIALYKFAKLGINPLTSLGKGKAIAGLVPENEIPARAKEAVLNKRFGSDVLSKYFGRDNSLKMQDDLRQKYLGETLDTLGQNEPTKNVSDILRSELYGDIENLQGQSNTVTKKVFDLFGLPKGEEKTTSLNVFFGSPEYKEFMKEIAVLQERGDKFASPSQIKEMIKTLSLPYKDPKAASFAKEDLLNLIQNRGAYRNSISGETSEVITPAMQEKLRASFNKYLENRVGSQKYNVLKEVERQEFVAQGRDSVANLVENNFKLGSKEFDTLINNIKTSPEGKKDLLIAAIQDISKQPNEKAMLSRLADLRKMLVEAEAIKPDDMRFIYNKIAQIKNAAGKEVSKGFDKAALEAERKQKLINAIVLPLSSTLVSESANLVGGAVRNRPLDVFSL